jgi:short subunit dehydrogenase-like uncharacterized protein
MSTLIYGANGYTGELTARFAVERGLKPILAGRNAAALAQLAGSLGLPHRVFSLDDAAAVDAGLAGVKVVLHCAGPFSRTSKAMVDACLRNQVHYLDITGEVSVFEACAARDGEAKKAGVVIMPGVGFDVVPSDCLAAHLKARLPSATHLALGFQGLGGVSRGTATTMAENLHRGGAIRKDGRLTPVPAAWRTRTIDFGRGPTAAVTIPWGDISTAYHSTRIPNIEVYMAAPWKLRAGMKLSRPLAPLLGTAPVQRFLKKRIQSGPPGPTDAQRARGKSLLWGEVSDDKGGRAEARLATPEGYTLTALTSLAVVERMLKDPPAAGYHTPSSAFGADFILGIDGVTRNDVS